jgi:hypothetical protein
VCAIPKERAVQHTLIITLALIVAVAWPSAEPARPQPGLSIVTDSTPCTCVVGAYHTDVFIADGSGIPGPFVWSISAGELAPGKRLEAKGGLTSMIRGAATQAGEYNFTLAVHAAANPAIRAERSYRVLILPAGPCPLKTAADAGPRRLPRWFAPVGGAAVALSLFPLCRRRRSGLDGGKP